MEDFYVDFDDPIQRRRLIEYLSQQRGKKVLYMENERNVRSVPLNNYWHSVILQRVCEYTGYTEDEAHEVLVQSFMPMVTFARYDDLTTTNLTNDEMWRLVEKVRFVILDLTGRYIPLPEKVLRPHQEIRPEDRAWIRRETSKLDRKIKQIKHEN